VFFVRLMTESDVNTTQRASGGRPFVAKCGDADSPSNGAAVQVCIALQSEMSAGRVHERAGGILIHCTGTFVRETSKHPMICVLKEN
jgi:hypothetical protein